MCDEFPFGQVRRVCEEGAGVFICVMLEAALTFLVVVVSVQLGPRTLVFLHSYIGRALIEKAY